MLLPGEAQDLGLTERPAQGASETVQHEQQVAALATKAAFEIAARDNAQAAATPNLLSITLLPGHGILQDASNQAGGCGISVHARGLRAPPLFA